MRFEDFFTAATGHQDAHPWQVELATDPACSNRVVRIPTGFGKTLGVLVAWLWHRVQQGDDRWPRRLVWCLPMRVLVEQTREETAKVLGALGLLWDGESERAGRVGLHLLMGGYDAGDWELYPEESAVLIGTQDMLLSRALNRGYAAPRARWPMDFGLLNQDCLWVMDEVQLMDVGLATSFQLQVFRDQDARQRMALRPHATWWMSATLQRDWLARSPDTAELIEALSQSHIEPGERTGLLWDGVSKPCRIEPVKRTGKAIANAIAQGHIAGGRGACGPTLVVLNRVDTAVEVWEALRQDSQLAGTDIRLVHGRFRPLERATWVGEFLNRAACGPGTDRIVVATQVIEAGVDFSAAVLFTELAPWASLVQRFGRCARWGGSATVTVLDFEPKDDKAAAPYSKAELDAARSALSALTRSAEAEPTASPADVSPLSLERFEESHPQLLPALYPFDPPHLLLRHELDELFDTTPDLSGADVDVSRFIRTGDERDLHCFWADLPPHGDPPPADLKPTRDALCAVPFLQAREWLCKPKSEALAPGKRAWVWDWQDGAWKRATRRDLFPGRTVLVAADTGGYDVERGFWRDSGPVPTPLSPEAPSFAALADDAQDSEALSACDWKTIATHGRETGLEARAIAASLVPNLSDILDLAGRHHDSGKVHPAFRGSIRDGTDTPDRGDLAKAPRQAWRPLRDLYSMPDGSRRRGLRHELASTLALFAVLQRHAPDHPALLGPWGALLGKAGLEPQPTPRDRSDASEPTPIEREILALDREHFDLLAYLVCTHHGKIRVAWHLAKPDQEAADAVLRIRGIRDGETLPALVLAAGDGSLHELPSARLDLSPASAGLSPHTGPSWTDRVLGLLDRYGPFALAYLEALLRAADRRASRLQVPDPLLENPNAPRALEASDRTMAQPPAGRADAPAAAEHPPQGEPQHGLRGRAGGSGHAGGGTRAPRHATRYLTTSLGILSYAELAPYLALRVQDVEASIAEGQYADRPVDEDLIRELHHRICGDLLPDMAGHWRRTDVRVGSHQAPRYPNVPILMRDYCRDLEARLAALADPVDDRLPEALAFAEGRLLWIHPFADFNGRTTRVLLAALLHRLGLPDIDPTPEPGPQTERYLNALRAADHADWRPLIDYWTERFAAGETP